MRAWMLPALAALLALPAAAADPVHVVVENPVCDTVLPAPPGPLPVPCYGAEVRFDPDAFARCMTELETVPPCVVAACPLMWPPRCGNDVWLVAVTSG